MSNEDNSSSNGGDNSGDFWAQALEGASKVTETAADDGGDPTGTAADNDEAGEQVQPQASEASTTPSGTEATAGDGNSTANITSGLETVPEEFRSIVAAAIAEKEKNLQAGYTTKFQSLADERKTVEALLKAQEDSGLDPATALQYASAFKQLQEAPGVRITQGEEVLWENNPQTTEPDWDTLTKAEIVAQLRKENEAQQQALVKQIQDSVQPMQQHHALENAQRLGQTWRASHDDVPDDVMNIAVAKAKEFEEMLPDGARPDLSTVEALNTFMTPFIALATSLKGKATSPTEQSQPTTEVPRKTSKAPRRNLKGESIEVMAEEAAKKLGFNSVTDVMATFKDA